MTSHQPATLIHRLLCRIGLGPRVVKGALLRIEGVEVVRVFSIHRYQHCRHVELHFDVDIWKFAEALAFNSPNPHPGSCLCDVCSGRDRSSR